MIVVLVVGLVGLCILAVFIYVLILIIQALRKYLKSKDVRIEKTK